MTQQMFKVPLAHKLPKAEALRLGATEVRDYDPNDDVVVPRGSAEMLAAAAMLQIHPSDHDGIKRLIEAGAVSDEPTGKTGTVPTPPTGKPNVATPGGVAATGK